ncbi:hypothetical protein BDV23DRAFT_159892 [Aspergillus alliaceus]|uniref:Uncharacterized protein n=1 Tax=Petromyces alliaceus TaxID=209559 RepID=A0A5N7C1P7_PETAA|nr:hypothetical protein BDV23DRAFT_159892 [Aspergillus alliaceus]
MTGALIMPRVQTFSLSFFTTNWVRRNDFENSWRAIISSAPQRARVRSNYTQVGATPYSIQ